MLGGVPGYVGQYLNAPSREDVQLIKERQDDVRQRLAVLEAEVARLSDDVSSLEEALRRHIEEEARK